MFFGRFVVVVQTETEKKSYRTNVKLGRKSSKKVCLEHNQMGNNSTVGDGRKNIETERRDRDRETDREYGRFLKYFGSFAQVVISCCLVIHFALHANESVFCSPFFA